MANESTVSVNTCVMHLQIAVYSGSSDLLMRCYLCKHATWFNHRSPHSVLRSTRCVTAPLGSLYVRQRRRMTRRLSRKYADQPVLRTRERQGGKVSLPGLTTCTMTPQLLRVGIYFCTKQYNQQKVVFDNA